MEPSYFDGIDNVFIHFDDKDGLYHGGQSLTGKIKILVKETTKIRHVKLLLTSRVKIKWVDVENGSTINYEELDFPLNEEIIIHEAVKSDVYSKWFYPGNKEFSFKYPLPAGLPYSLDGSKYGRIEYKCKTVVTVGNGKTSESMEEEFFIRSRTPRDEEALIELASLNYPKKNVEYGRVGGGCLSKPSVVEICLNLDKTMFKQGEKVEDTHLVYRHFFVSFFPNVCYLPVKILIRFFEA